MSYIPREQNRKTFFEESVFAARSVQFSYKPIAGGVVSNFRDKIVTSSAATVTEGDSEICLSTGAGVNGNVLLRTKRRMQYVSGIELEIGTGIRIPTLPVGTQEAKWGYFDDENGFGCGVDVTGSYTFSVRSGSINKKRQNSWAVDTLNGSGSSGLSLDLSSGNIFNIIFSWYGYGDATFYAYPYSPSAGSRKRTMFDRIVTENSTSIQTPNQPISVEVNNGSVGGDFRVYVGGRQASSLGPLFSAKRTYSGNSLQVPVTSSTNFVNLFSMKKKNLLNNGRKNTIQVLLNSYTVTTNQSVLIELLYSLSGSVPGTYQNPPNIPAAETGLELLFSGSNPIGDVFLLDSKVLNAASTRNSRDFANVSIEREVILADDDVITLRARALGDAATVSMTLDWDEEW